MRLIEVAHKMKNGYDEWYQDGDEGNNLDIKKKQQW